MILIKNAQVFAPKALGKKDVLLAYDKILEIADCIEPWRDDLTVIDAAGKMLVPGFIDQHVHSVGDMANLYRVVYEMVTQQGVALEKALPFITSNVARALELYPRKGCIAEGSDADMVLLDEGYQIDTVLAKGRIMMQDKQVLVKGTFE